MRRSWPFERRNFVESCRHCQIRQWYVKFVAGNRQGFACVSLPCHYCSTSACVPLIEQAPSVRDAMLEVSRM